ncbi:MAG: glycosyltransferase family 39 protein [archaeon]
MELEKRDWLWCGIIVLALVLMSVYVNIQVSGFLQGDEVTEVLDGIFIMNYVGDSIAQGSFINPLQYATDFQSKSFGLTINNRPLYFRGLEAVLFGAFGVNLLIPRLLSLFHAIGFFLIWYFWIKQEYSEKVAVFSSFIMLTSWKFVMYSWRITMEFPYLLFLFLSLFLFVKYYRSRDEKYVLPFFATVFLGLMTKNVMLFLFPIIALYLIIRWRFRINKEKLCDLKNLVFKKRFVFFGILTGALAVPWYFLSITTSSTVQGLVNDGVRSFNPLTYLILIVKEEPIILVGFLVYVLFFLFYRRADATTWERDAPYLAALVVFYTVLSAMGWKHFRYIAIIYPVFALFTGVVLANLRKIGYAVFALILLFNVFLFVGYMQTPAVGGTYEEFNANLKPGVFEVQGIQDVPDKWGEVAEFMAEVEPQGNVLYAGYPGNFLYSYHINMLGRPEVRLVRDHPSDVAQFDTVEDVVEHYDIEYIVYDTELDLSYHWAKILPLVGDELAKDRYEKIGDVNKVEVYRIK